MDQNRLSEWSRRGISICGANPAVQKTARAPEEPHVLVVGGFSPFNTDLKKLDGTATPRAKKRSKGARREEKEEKAFWLKSYFEFFAVSTKLLDGLHRDTGHAELSSCTETLPGSNPLVRSIFSKVSYEVGRS